MKVILLIVCLSFGLVGCDRKPAPAPAPASAGAVPPKFTPEETARSLALLAYESGKNAARFAVLDAVDRTKVPHLKEFLALYPEAVVRYLSFAGGDFPSLDVTTTLYGRYEFNMRIPVTYAADNRTIAGYGSPECHLLEIASVDRRGDGSGGIELGGTSGGELQKHFGEKEWKALVAARGDFAKLGFELKKDAPVPDFDLVVKHLKSLERKLPKKAEQGGEGQSAAPARPEREGGNKPELESEGRSR